jgi:hypothetical protein
MDKPPSRVSWGVITLLLALTLVAIPIAVFATCQIRFAGRGGDLDFGLASIQVGAVAFVLVFVLMVVAFILWMRGR